MQTDEFNALQQLVTMLSRSRIGEVCIKTGEATLTLSFAEITPAGERNAQGPTVIREASSTSAPHIVRSPGMGYFRRCHPLGKPVSLPEIVTAGQVVGYLQFEEVIAEVVTDVGGAIGAPLVEERAVVGYGEPLYVVS
ncbi:hypothetical protein [Klebsiella pneumoniae]|uniref:hypothetical protein n=1 Tax=Klebsiella pneumoniae TaxID=573 RepID=UPI0007CD10DD|nr:hypothetical protein [Klebsiella pneumoniae]SAV14849.1 acetyl-CoA carboxylase biotin carboxyl carrier protein subunit [Klebsiella pneumoniae]